MNILLPMITGFSIMFAITTDRPPETFGFFMTGIGLIFILEERIESIDAKLNKAIALAAAKG